MSKRSTWKHKLAAILISCFMIFIVLLFGEIYCRVFTRINFLGSSRELFTPARYGRSWGNTPNLEDISYGEKFHIDAEGFRTDPKFSPAVPADAPAILIVGDSVAFGAGVKDNETITERLRREIPDRRFYDASSIGYQTFDYKNVIETLIKRKPEIQTVALFFCINDITDISAAEIRLQANSDEKPDPEPHKTSFADKINQFLRSRSKLYLLIKNAILDTQLIYLRDDVNYYRDNENVKFSMQPIADVKKTLDEAGVKFKIFLLPYEAQLRPGTQEDLLMPQRKVGEFLRSNNIDYYDTTADFKNGGSPELLYLFADPMHFSADGSKVAADAACRNLGENCAAAP